MTENTKPGSAGKKEKDGDKKSPKGSPKRPSSAKSASEKKSEKGSPKRSSSAGKSRVASPKSDKKSEKGSPKRPSSPKKEGMPVLPLGQRESNRNQFNLAKARADAAAAQAAAGSKTSTYPSSRRQSGSSQVSFSSKYAFFLHCTCSMSVCCLLWVAVNALKDRCFISSSSKSEMHSCICVL